MVHRHDFGKVLCGAGSVLERVFTIRNDGAEAVELKEFQGFPSCCVTLEPIAPVQKTLMAGESFAARMTIDPAPKPGPETWRGIVTTADRKRSFFVEAAADMLPVVYAAWDDDTAVELEVGSSTVRSGAVQIIGEGSPQGLRI